MGSPRKYDWPKLRQEWLTGKYKNIHEMAKKKHMPERTLLNKSAAENWMSRKQEIEERTEERVIEKTIEIKANRRIETLEKQLKYAQVMIGLSLNTFSGKKKLKKESDGISMLRLGIETQLKVLRELRSGDEPVQELPTQGDINVNVNIANLSANAHRDLTNDQINFRRQQIADEIKRLQNNAG
jgi:hypothetical protein